MVGHTQAVAAIARQPDDDNRRPRRRRTVSEPENISSDAGNENHPGRAHHDLGGVSRYVCASVDTTPHALSAFDKQVDALRQLLSAKGLMSVDELRRGIEAIPEAEYHALSYYQRWMRSIAATLLARGVIDDATLRTALAERGADRGGPR
jgi:hypothetical protein